MRSNHFLDEVSSYIRSKEAKKYIEAELKAHLHQAKTELVKKGYTEDEAEELAVRGMGSPSDIGLRMDKLHRPKIDWKLISVFLFMSATGLFLFWFLFKNGNSFSVLKQVYSVTGSFILACVLLFFDYRKLQRWGWGFFSIGCLILVKFQFSNIFVHGSPRINIMGLLSVDSIVVLPLFLLAWAGMLQSKKMNVYLAAILYICSAFLFMVTVNLQAVALYSLMVAVMVWKSGLNKRKIIITAAVLLSACVSLLLISLKDIRAYQFERLYAFVTPERFVETSGYMYLKLEKLIADAGWIGHLSSHREIDFSNEMMTDFIFVTITYTLGWAGALLIGMLFLWIIWRISHIFQTVKDPFGKMLVSGIFAIFTAQVTVSIGMSLGLLPIISISLPFMSYGALSAMINAFLFGLVLSVYHKKDIILMKKI
ncbi:MULTISPECIES: FtsW/RodA/SpoVE family cell cycle protein [unclassified Bacillus (in: firmicutes)]|uniref:FtsW/RodA/SpoVE family cell cycle protein n=1 Tax=unclassified Bacillus (in: firmicutes) TaxID=185979 RepID=UPI001BECE989|nr:MULTISPECIES: FtsW/RodA/SpoVE family cell cycle protein [unclassified Bacillus (in: firmicutes)]MBT2616265.1 FtsW/RodA/SpoVE family cell cycle protein [Bacillus sp. ISL-78]MBT2632267.1 FtsW/RodA/SpoVE family cell cycle protein [Bacillus sp. ISL-101]MBT2719392.1 FtsW/RodA/SpoVE family cell cycle protein [Bacillus sp. ISL-57]